MSFSRGAAGFNRSVLNRDVFGEVLYCNLDSNTASRGSVIAIRVYQLSGSSGTLSKCTLSTRIIDKLANVRGGFNTQPHNRDDFGSVLYCNVESDTVSSGNCAAEIIFYVSGITNTISSVNINTEDLELFISAIANTLSSGNSDTEDLILFISGITNTISSGNCAAESIFYVSGIAKTLSSAEIIIKIYKTISMVYSGALAVGETVCIDGEKFTVKLDGANAIDKFTGDFPMILPDKNSISYEDSESARTVKVIVSRRDRHI